MTKLIAEWVWRIAVLVLLAWIGAELHALHDDLMAPADDQPATTSTPASLRDEPHSQPKVTTIAYKTTLALA